MMSPIIEQPMAVSIVDEALRLHAWFYCYGIISPFAYHRYDLSSVYIGRSFLSSRLENRLFAWLGPCARSTGAFFFLLVSNPD